MVGIRALVCWAIIAVILTGCAHLKKTGTDAQISSFCYQHSGMHTGLIYTYNLQKENEGYTAYYDLNGGQMLFSVPVDADFAAELKKIVDENNLYAWDGFDEAPYDVLDGESFTLRIEFEDGTKIRACGSNSYPKGYQEAYGEIQAVFERYSGLAEQ
ncbi:MAG: hypothetical protein E7335_08455 [Clostridiales bacterium]|nr:hypothetical protein [Clostridiales bacterium]